MTRVIEIIKDFSDDLEKTYKNPEKKQKINEGLEKIYEKEKDSLQSAINSVKILTTLRKKKISAEVEK